MQQASRGQKSTNELSLMHDETEMQKQGRTAVVAGGITTNTIRLR